MCVCALGAQIHFHVYTHMCILPPFLVHFFQSLKHSNPLPGRITFFSAQGKLHLFIGQAQFQLTHLHLEDFGFSQQFDFSFLEKVRKDFQNLRMAFLFWRGGGGWEEHTKKLVPEFWLPKKAFGAECFEVSCFFKLLDVLFFSIPVVSHSHFNTSIP